VPTESEVLRHFARRAVHTLQQMLLHISRANIHDHPYLIEAFNRDQDRVTFLKKLQETVQRPLWSIDGEVEVRHVLINDSRLGASQ